MSRRTCLLVLCLALLGASLSGCGENENFEDELRAAMRRTEAAPRTFFYTDETAAQEVVVRGAVEDDFRYRARVEVNEVPALDEVVTDDVLAVRLLEPQLAPLFVSKTAATEAQQPVVQALQSGSWVVDDSGAPSLVAGPKEERKVGDDFIIDALNVFRYIELAIIEAPPGQRVVRFNPESINYRPKEDPFPQPKGDIERYDIARARVPRRSDTGGGNQSVPGTSVFRKMSIYVKDGHVIEVREFIDIGARLEDLEKNYGIDLRKSRSVDDAISEVVRGINAVRQGQGLDLLRPRRMLVRFDDIGKRQEVKLPTEGVVEGDLGFLVNRGKRSVAGPDAGAAPAAGADQSTDDGDVDAGTATPEDGVDPASG